MMQEKKIKGEKLGYRPLSEAELRPDDRTRAYATSQAKSRTARIMNSKLRKASRDMIESHPNSAHWFCLRVETGKEQAVETVLAEANVEAFMPTEKLSRVQKGRKIDSFRPFFPGYIFVRCVPSAEAFSALCRASNRIYGLVGGSVGCYVIPDAHISVFKGILERADVSRMPADKSIGQGDRAEISFGPFAEFACVVTAVKWSREPRASVRIHVEGRAFDIDSMPLAFLKKL
ncbi:transcription termination/antitermination protein NusG [Rhizobium halophytocola]|uniref:Transcriptional antiterminator NusG n=1 Tax=Rhizobium halophytocola TaxID=735519 RepID=A0ABS4E2F3_9HYPH|nr:transcription termination/antitermination NusG family protein [Rhizobium halophytocola]MBP1852134.1 transcriptional antiterminator NusG [Rhizobium halophytocola]